MVMPSVAWRLAAVVLMALGPLAAVALPAHAFSGDVFPGTPPGQVPTYTIPAGSAKTSVRASATTTTCRT